MDQSPGSLQDLCINVLADKPDILWRWKDGSVFSEATGVEWRDPTLFLHSQFADRLLEIFSNNGKLGDEILSTFTQEHACLKNVKIAGDMDNITKDGLQVLSHHKLISLNIQSERRFNFNICTVLECIEKKSSESLQRLLYFPRTKINETLFFDSLFDLPRNCWPRDDDLAGQSVVETLSRFNCLKSVDVNDTYLTNTMLTILGKSLLHVENLDLSWNFKITDISPLKNRQKTLKSLSLCGLADMTAESAMDTLVTLTGLTYLDVSMMAVTLLDSYVEYDSPSHRDGKNVFTADMLLQKPDVLPNLRCLDLSCRAVRREQALSQFLEAHQSLQMLVLWGSDACQFKSLQDFSPRLTVGGDATLEQYVAVLRHWTRIEGLKGLMNYCRKPAFVMINLKMDLWTKHFPPCQDDQLIQAVLGICPSQLNHCCDRAECFQEYFCLEIISLLFEKGIINLLEPDTALRLLQLCHRAVRQFHRSGARKLAKKILQTVTEQASMSERLESA